MSNSERNWDIVGLSFEGRNRLLSKLSKTSLTTDYLSEQADVDEVTISKFLKGDAVSYYAGAIATPSNKNSRSLIFQLVHQFFEVQYQWR